MKKKIMGGIGFVIMLAGILVLTNIGPMFATNIQDEENKRQEMENELKDVETVIQELEQYKSNQEEYISRLDVELTDVTNAIHEYKRQEEQKQDQIAKKKKQIKAAKEDIKEQYEDMKKRIQFMFENGNSLYEEMLLSSHSFSDFLNRAEYISELTEYDRNMLEKLKKAKEKLDKQMAKLKRQEEELNDLIARTEARQSDMEAMIAEKQSVIKEYNEDITNKEDAKAALEQDIKAQEALIEELKELERKRREEEERRRREAEAKKQQADLPTYDGGIFKWPLPGYTAISSEFGYRSDPFTGETSYHNGIDIPAPEGTPIVAAYDGEVVWAYYSDTAGNWIGIDHGDGITTIYMHSSQLLVSAGEKVTAGQTIALVGTTGRSTGNHLHFTVRVNGEDVNPHNYVGG